jgi:hypothetical protein
MPQMDFSTFFTQVFWLSIFIIFFFMYFLRGLFSYSIFLLKLKGSYFFTYFYFLKLLFLQIYYEISTSVKIIIFKFVSILTLYEFFNKINVKNSTYFSNINSIILESEQSFQNIFTLNLLSIFNKFFNYISFSYYFYLIGEIELQDSIANFEDEEVQILSFVEFLTYFLKDSDNDVLNLLEIVEVKKDSIEE